MNFKQVSWTLAAGLATLAIAACGGSSSGSSGSGNGVASKSADEIVAAAQSAAQSAKSVHVSGSVTSNGRPITLDLHLASGLGGRGSIAVSGADIEVVTIGSTVYLKASPSFWQLIGNPQAGQVLKNRWLKAPATGSVSSFTAFTNLRQLFGSLLSSHGKLTKGQTATIGGQQAIGVKDTSHGGTLYVATTGAPYPLQVSKVGGGGAVSFDHYNEPVALSAPAGALDSSKLH